MKKLLSMILCTAMLLGVLSGCSSSKEETPGSSTNASESGTQNHEKIKIGVSAFPGWFIWYIAQGENFFEKNGVEVELVWFPIYSDSLQAFNAGKVDMVCASICDTIAPYSQGVDFKAVVITDYSDGGDAIVAKNEYTTLQDLKGKTVATEYGTIDHFFLIKALENNGMSIEDVNFINMSIQDAGPALLSGSIDAACLLEPVLTMATSGGANRVLYSTQSTPGLVQDLTIVQTKVYEERYDEIKKIVKTFFDSIEFYNTNTDKAYEDMMGVAGVTKEEMPDVMRGAKLLDLKDNLTSMTVQQDSNLYLANSGQQKSDYLFSINMTDKTFTADDIQQNIIAPKIVEELAAEAGVTAN